MHWRLIPQLDLSGQWQMAIDAWLLDQHRQGRLPPTLRFYTWNPPAISLGYHQRHWPEHWPHLTWQDQPIHLVRRPSGGRAVLHQGDLTYAVVTTAKAQNRLRTYQAVCEFLLQGWRSLGVPLQYGQAGRGYIHNPDCFGTATGADLVLADGAKLIGSAQLRRGLAVLQHGSMRLTPDEALFQQVFGTPMRFPDLPLPRLLEDRTATVVAALTAAAAACFETEFYVQPLAAHEWDAIRQTIAETVP